MSRADTPTKHLPAGTRHHRVPFWQCADFNVFNLGQSDAAFEVALPFPKEHVGIFIYPERFLRFSVANDFYVIQFNADIFASHC